MKLLVAALLPTRGEILVDGQPLDRTERLLKARLGYLPQDFGLFDELAVTQFLDYIAALKGIGDPKAAIQKAVRAVNLEEKAGPKSARSPADSASGWVLPRRFWGTRPS